jgi:benzoyl-CoA reductase/2-hydroxyglutaryl-CoA dehydratase subunit BcrC/BadD/HgdB
MTIGSMIKDKSFLGVYPRSTAVIGMEETCNIQAKWFEILARYHNLPYFLIDTPFMDINNYPNWGEEALKDCVDYLVKQLGNYIDFMEWALNQKLDEEKMITACVNQRHNEVLWDRVMQLWRRVPSPITIRNLFTFENLIVSLPCQKAAGDVLEALIQELHERIEKGITGIVDEKYRLVWNAQPGWYTLGAFKYIEAQGATFVASPYLEIWGAEEKFSGSRAQTPEWFRAYKEPAGIDECLSLIARETIARHPRPRLTAQIETLTRLARESKADGVVWHAVRACKGVSYGQLAEKEVARDELGIPSLVFEGSPADPRHFNEGQVMSQITIFMEQIKENKIKN